MDKFDKLTTEQFDGMFGALTAPEPDEWLASFGDKDIFADEERSMRPSEVHKFLGIGRSTLYQWVKDGSFPKPTRQSAKVSVWRRGDVIAARDAKGLGDVKSGRRKAS